MESDRRRKDSLADVLTNERAGAATISLPPSLSSLLSFRAIAAAAIFCGLVYLAGDQRHPLPPSVGSSLSGRCIPTSDTSPAIRVATFNIHSGTGRDRRNDLARTAAALTGVDIAFLNEVQGRYFWQSAGQTELLGELTARRWLFAPTEQRWWHHQFGNAALSADNVMRWQTFPLPSHGRSYRNAVLIDLEHAGRTVRILGTHFDRNSADDRAEQFRAVSGLFLDLAEPAILLGDLNATAEDDAIQSLLAHEGVRDPLRDALGDAVDRHIDWILTRGMKTIDAGIIDNGASDHPLVWAELE